jgi:hypothetical protein
MATLKRGGGARPLAEFSRTAMAEPHSGPVTTAVDYQWDQVPAAASPAPREAKS